MTKTKAAERSNQGSQGAAKPPAGPVAAPPVRVAPLFRGIDWLALVFTFAVVWTIYYFTLAPELTLEDSGELVTGSLYAGIPHPPGYPVWTIYSWLWTALVPWGNMAWRVALGEATLGALAAGLVSLLVSRGSSLFMEGIEELKNMTGQWESAICLVSGVVAGLLMGLDGFMWRESVAVNRIAVTSVPWFLIVLTCLLRWLYAPHQYRFLCWALFVFGICFTTHQSLLVAALGIEVAIAYCNPRLGRDLYLGNFVIYMLANFYQMVTAQYVFSNLSKGVMQAIFHIIGLGSLAISIWLATKVKTKAVELGRNFLLFSVASSLLIALLTKGQGGLSPFFALVCVGSLIWFAYLAWKTWSWSREWLVVFTLGVLWFLGASFYFYMAVSGMTNPPMQWGYPRTVEGFFHALSRGQYEQPNPTNVFLDPIRFIGQVWMLIQGAADEYTWVYLFIALVPFLFLFRMQKRERVWLVSLAALYFFLGVFLMILFNPTPERASADLIKVFFCNSHAIVAMLIGYGLALTAAFMATHYQQFRIWGLIGGAVAIVLGLFCLFLATDATYFGPAGGMPFGEWPHWIATAFAKNRTGLPVFGNMVLVFVPLALFCALLAYRERGPLFITLGLFLTMPLYSALAHYYASNQRNHWFGYWFGHDMFTPPFKGADSKPIYPEMTKDAVLYGGTDPGRFCPTYMIFCESFTPHDCQPLEDQKFDRRDVYIITQNALADGTYLDYIRAHYNRSKQIDPPFFQEFVRPSREKELNYETNLLARAVSPLDTLFEGIGEKVEKRRRTYTSWFIDKDFVDLPAFVARLSPAGGNQDSVSKFLYDNLSAETRQLIANKGNDTALRQALAKDLNVVLDRELEAKKELSLKQQEKSGVDQKLLEGSTSESLKQKQAQLAKEIADLAKVPSLYDSNRFAQVQISEYLQDFIKQDPQSHTRVRLNRLLLEAVYPKEIAKSLGGVYPDREMYIASPEDSQKCFNEYLADAQRRLQHDMQFPNEPKQIRMGEDVKVIDNRVTVSGQVAVMAINGLLTKVMFDHNPKNEFFVEESFPLDWMYPHLTPYGVIMKINREQLPTLSDDVLKRDHVFWKQYSKRLIGDWIDYDTSIKEIADWIEKTYLRHDFNGFTGDRKFVRDDDGQKAFSKLRSSIGGIYAWRLQEAPPQFRPKNEAEYQAILREAEFTFRQAFAFCPYSPEAVFRYVNLLTRLPNRIDDALLIAETCLKLDPYNGQVIGLVANLRAFKAQQQAGAMPPQANDLQLLQEQVRSNPTNFQLRVELARLYLQMQQTNMAGQTLDPIMTTTANLSAADLIRAAQLYGAMGNWSNLEAMLEKLVKVSPDSPEAWYDLAGFKANLSKSNEAIAALTRALDLNTKRLQTNPKAPDLISVARTDPRFNGLRQTPEFQKLVPAK